MSLRLKIVGLTAVLLVAVAVFLLVFLPAQMESSARRWAAAKAQDLVLVMGEAIAPALVFEESEAVAIQLRTLEASSDAVYAEVRRADGSRLAGWNLQNIPAGIKLMPDPNADKPRVVFRDGVAHVAAQVGALEEAGSGLLQLGFSLGALEEEKKAALMTSLLVSGSILFIGLLLSFLIGTLLIRPIIQLTEVTQKIVAEGDLTQEIKITTTDEVGTLASSFSQLVEKLKTIPKSLGETVMELTHSVGRLRQVITEQTAVIQRQASGITEATSTAEEIKQTAAVASTKLETVLEVAAKSEEFSQAGIASVEASLVALADIASQVDEIVERIADLSERTLRVGEITETVKDLADQSNVLALNAAIEAARAGEAGKGFAVVAREIRTLADQSIQSTGRIRDILSEIQGAIRSTVEMTGTGKQKMEQGMEQIRSSGENFREMATIVQDSARAARQIGASVSQQNAGIEQLSAAIADLNDAMGDVKGGIEESQAAVESVSGTSNRIGEIMREFRV